jgi:hypothetical protein
VAGERELAAVVEAVVGAAEWDDAVRVGDLLSLTVRDA